MIEQILANEAIPVKDIEIVTEDEKNELLYKINKPNIGFPKNKTIVDLDKLESTIDTLKSSFMEESKTNVALEYNVIEFDKGENFLEWIDEKKLSLSEFKESEIVQ